MPSQKPRMALTLPPEVRAAVDGLAEAVGKPSATVVADLLRDMVPQLLDLAKIARAAKAGNNAAAKKALQHMLGNAMAEVVAENQPDLFKRGKAKPR